MAVPSHLTPAIDLCLDGLENLRRSPEAIYGYSAALASLLGAVRYCKDIKLKSSKTINKSGILVQLEA